MALRTSLHGLAACGGRQRKSPTGSGRGSLWPAERRAGRHRRGREVGRNRDRSRWRYARRSTAWRPAGGGSANRPRVPVEAVSGRRNAERGGIAGEGKLGAIGTVVDGVTHGV